MNGNTSNEIFDLLRQMEERINKKEQSMKSIGSNTFMQIPIGTTLIKEERKIINEPQTLLTIDNSNEFLIRKIIRDEFQNLIFPYQKDLYNSINVLENKINSSCKPSANYMSNIPLQLYPSCQTCQNCSGLCPKHAAMYGCNNSRSNSNANEIRSPFTKANEYVTREEFEAKVGNINDRINQCINIMNNIPNKDLNLNMSSSINKDSNKDHNKEIDELKNKLLQVEQLIKKVDFNELEKVNLVELNGLNYDDLKNLREMKSQIRENKNAIDVLQSQNNKLENVPIAEEIQMSSINNGLDENLVNEIKKVDFDELSKTNFKQINGLNDRVNFLQNSVNTLNNKVTDHEKKINDIERKLNQTNNDSLDNLKNEIKNLSNRANGFNEKITQIETKIEYLELNSKAPQNDEISRASTGLEEKVVQLQMKVNQLESSIDSVQDNQKIKELESKINNLESNAKGDSPSDTGKKISELENQLFILDNLQKETEKKTENLATNKEIKDLETKLNNHIRQCSSYASKKNLKDLEDELNEKFSKMVADSQQDNINNSQPKVNDFVPSGDLNLLNNQLKASGTSEVDGLDSKSNRIAVDPSSLTKSQIKPSRSPIMSSNFDNDSNKIAVDPSSLSKDKDQLISSNPPIMSSNFVDPAPKEENFERFSLERISSNENNDGKHNTDSNRPEIPGNSKDPDDWDNDFEVSDLMP